jgi:hypothetical protein
MSCRALLANANAEANIAFRHDIAQHNAYCATINVFHKDLHPSTSEGRFGKVRSIFRTNKIKAANVIVNHKRDDYLPISADERAAMNAFGVSVIAASLLAAFILCMRLLFGG